MSARPDPRGVLALDRVVHEPARFLILSILASAKEVEFKFLESSTGLTRGNISSHASKLEEAGYLEVHKAFRGKIPVTSFRITREGSKALANYKHQLHGAIGG